MIRRVAALTLSAALALLMTLGGGDVQAQPQIADVAPSDLPAYLEAHPKVVVLFTSPDSKCGFCVGADSSFHQAVMKLQAIRSTSDEWRYIVVQWQPWRSFPAEVQVLGVGGIPHRGAFVRGQQVGEAGGRVANIEQLAEGILAAQAGQRWTPPPSPPKPPTALPRGEPGRPRLSHEEFVKKFTKPMRGDWVDVQARREYLQGLLKRCTVLHDQAEALLRPQHKEWNKKVFETVYDLSQAAWLETTEGIRAIAQQQAVFEQSLREQTGLAQQDRLSLAQCQQLSAAAASRPVPLQPPRGS